MKLKILSIFFVVVVAQMQTVQGSPLLSLSDLMGTALNILTGTVTTVTNTVSGTISFLSKVLNSAVQTISNGTTQSTANINRALAATDELVAIGTSIIEIAEDDPISTIEAVFTNTADQLLPNIEDTLAPISDFGNAVSKLITNTTTLLSNPIGNINQALAGLSSTLNSADDLFQSVTNLISKGVSKSSDVLQTVAIPIGNVVNYLATTILSEIRFGLYALSDVSDNIRKVLNTASNLTKALAADAAASNQGLTKTVFPITAALTTPINNIAKAVNSVPETIDNAINRLQNVAVAVQAICDTGYEDALSVLSIIAPACVNNGSNAAANFIADGYGTAVLCITNEIPKLLNYLTLYRKLVSQYQFGVVINNINISTLQQTIQTSVNLQLYILSVKLRIEGCIAARFLQVSGHLLPIAASAVNCGV